MNRNYAAEYARRVSRGLSQGLTRSQARGHPGPGQVLVSAKNRPSTFDTQLEAAVKQIRAGKSLTKASDSVGVSAERVRSYLASQGIGEKVRGRWKVGEDDRIREILIYSNGAAKSISVRGYEASRLVGEYLAAVNRFLETNDPSFLKPYIGKSIKGTGKHRHPFETDLNTLHRLASGAGDDMQRIYRIQL